MSDIIDKLPPIPHQVWLGDQPASEMFTEYREAREWTIAKGYGHLDGRWLVKMPGVTIRSQAEIERDGKEEWET